MNDSSAPAPITAFTGVNGFLSNFAALEVPLTDPDGLIFITAEHAFQAAKTLIPRERALIAGATTPGRAKRLGRTITLRPDWDKERVAVMTVILAAKFAQPSLRAALLSTGEASLVEGNLWHDIFWGVCNCSQHAGSGENMLGRLLTQLRARLRTSVV